MLQLLADASGQNIVVSDSVSGNVTLRLQNVPWDQALDIVLRTKGLDKRKKDNVIIVAPAEELAAREKAELAASKDMQELAPLRTEYLQVNYAKASDLAAPDQVAGRQRPALQARQRRGRRAHQHPAAAGHGRSPRRHPPPGRDARHSGPPGADRSAHRHRQRRLHARARRARRLHRLRTSTATMARVHQRLRAARNDTALRLGARQPQRQRPANDVPVPIADGVGTARSTATT